MTIKQIERAQRMANVKFETAKKIVELLAAAEAEFKKHGGTAEDWTTELEEIQRLAFEGDE